MPKTKIEWTEYSWNPVTGCTPISEGCRNCYAARMAKRLAGRCGYPKDEPFKVTLHPERLEEPFSWRKPRRVFVCSMGDLFHPDVPEKFIYDIWDVMVKNRQHTFLILSKRPDRMKSFIERVMANRMDYAYMLGNTPEGKEVRKWAQRPIQNIWLGVTAENQEQADKRIPVLLQIPAAVRFVSVEPMLGPVNLTRINLGVQKTRGYGSRQIIWDALSGWEKQYETNRSLRSMFQQTPKCMSNDIGGRLNWVICGGETGPGARPMHPDWVRDLRDQCVRTGVPFLFKSWGEFAPSPDTEMGSEYWVTPDGNFGRWDYSDPSMPVSTCMDKVGKKAAGYLIDGQEWRQFPEVS